MNRTLPSFCVFEVLNLLFQRMKAEHPPFYPNALAQKDRLKIFVERETIFKRNHHEVISGSFLTANEEAGERKGRENLNLLRDVPYWHVL